MAHLTCASQSRDRAAAGRRVVRRGRHPARPGHPRRHAGRADGALGAPPGGSRQRHRAGRAGARAGRLLRRASRPSPTCTRETPRRRPDARLLVAKARAGASFAITQLFFTADDYFALSPGSARWAATCRSSRASCRSPNVRQIDRFAELSGAALPDAVAERLQAVADDDDAGPPGRASSSPPSCARSCSPAARRAALLHP